MKSILAIVVLCGTINPGFADDLQVFSKEHPGRFAKLEVSNNSDLIAGFQKMTRSDRSKNYSVSENCPCRTPKGACRYDSSGKPASNC
jgi:hypothetical protein